MCEVPFLLELLGGQPFFVWWFGVVLCEGFGNLIEHCFPWRFQAEGVGLDGGGGDAEVRFGVEVIPLEV